MENFKKFELNNAELVFGGALWRTSNAQSGQADIYNDETGDVYIIDGPLNP